MITFGKGRNLLSMPQQSTKHSCMCHNPMFKCLTVFLLTSWNYVQNSTLMCMHDIINYKVTQNSVKKVNCHDWLISITLDFVHISQIRFAFSFVEKIYYYCFQFLSLLQLLNYYNCYLLWILINFHSITCNTILSNVLSLLEHPENST